MRHFLFITLFLAVITAEAKHQEPIVYIDMRYTLRADYRDSVAVVGVWDDLHTISALQGIVNRDKPRLYIEYIETNGRSIDAYWWNRYRSEVNGCTDVIPCACRVWRRL